MSALLRGSQGAYSEDASMTPLQEARRERNLKWREEYEAGSTLQQIANRYDIVNLTAIRNGIIAVGGTMRPTGYRKGDKDKNKPRKGLLGWVRP